MVLVLRTVSIEIMQILVSGFIPTRIANSDTGTRDLVSSGLPFLWFLSWVSCELKLMFIVAQCFNSLSYHSRYIIRIIIVNTRVANVEPYSRSSSSQSTSRVSIPNSSSILRRTSSLLTSLSSGWFISLKDSEKRLPEPEAFDLL